MDALRLEQRPAELDQGHPAVGARLGWQRVPGRVGPVEQSAGHPLGDQIGRVVIDRAADPWGAVRLSRLARLGELEQLGPDPGRGHVALDQAVDQTALEPELIGAAVEALELLQRGLRRVGRVGPRRRGRGCRPDRGARSID